MPIHVCVCGVHEYVPVNWRPLRRSWPGSNHCLSWLIKLRLRPKNIFLHCHPALLWQRHHHLGPLPSYTTTSWPVIAVVGWLIRWYGGSLARWLAGWLTDWLAGHFSWLATRRSKVKAKANPKHCPVPYGQQTHTTFVALAEPVTVPAAQLPAASLLLARNTDATSFLAN